MKLVIFGLSVSSAWGNGHATLWRGLIRNLARRGHDVIFFEQDTPYYAQHRDLETLPGAELVLYGGWPEVRARAKRALIGADVGLVTSYCPDAIAASDLVLSSKGLSVFYDLDTPVTLDVLREGGRPPYLGERGLRDFDLVLSFTGGGALAELETRLGARRTAALYGSVDVLVHRPMPAQRVFEADLSYLGTWSADRQAALEALFLEPARRRPAGRFILAGALYPPQRWPPNVRVFEHVRPEDHPAFYGSSPLTLNLTRGPMARLGWCPSGRLFEAAACGIPVLSDPWEGLDHFFRPGFEILVAQTTGEALDVLSMDRGELARIAWRARERALVEHTADLRADELVSLLEAARRPEPQAAATPGRT